ncbi:MAG: hypothetical protein RQ966_12860 [Acetobacteraceae bacterium]|nr:hypothetical protein [Acetobacteraceae bacterium]
MTIIGFIACLGGDLGFAWADTAAFSGPSNRPAGHVSKLTMNPLACLAGVRAGWNLLGREGASVATEALTMDEAAEKLPGRLRQAAARAASSFATQPETFAGNIFGLLGWSPSLRRVVGVRFDAHSYFAPCLATRLAEPHVDGLAALDPASPFDVLGVAAAQLAALQRDLAEPITGDLVVAELRPGAVATVVLPGFATRPADLAGAPPVETAHGVH